MNDETQEQPSSRRISRKALIVAVASFLFVAGGAGYIYKTSLGGVSADAVQSSIIVSTDKNVYQTGENILISIKNNSAGTNILRPINTNLTAQIRRADGSNRSVIYMGSSNVVLQPQVLAPGGKSGDSVAVVWNQTMNRLYNSKTKTYGAVDPAVAVTPGKYEVLFTGLVSRVTFEIKALVPGTVDANILSYGSGPIGYDANGAAIVYYGKRSNSRWQIYGYNTATKADEAVAVNDSGCDMYPFVSSLNHLLAIERSDRSCNGGYQPNGLPSDNIQIIDLQNSNQVVATVGTAGSVDSKLRVLGWSPDGTKLLMSDLKENVFKIFDSKTLTTLDMTKPNVADFQPETVVGAAWQNKNKILAVYQENSTAAKRAFEVDATTFAHFLVTLPDMGNYLGYLHSHDRDVFYVTSTAGDGQIAVKGVGVDKIIPNTLGAFSSDFLIGSSGNSKKVFFKTVNGASGQDLYSVSLDGQKSEAIMSYDPGFNLLGWLGDYNHFAFLTPVTVPIPGTDRSRLDRYEIHSFDLSTKEDQKLVDISMSS